MKEKQKQKFTKSIVFHLFQSFPHVNKYYPLKTFKKVLRYTVLYFRSVPSLSARRDGSSSPHTCAGAGGPSWGSARCPRSASLPSCSPAGASVPTTGRSEEGTRREELRNLRPPSRGAHKAETLTMLAELGTFVAWPGLPGPGLLSPSGVSAGGVGMLMMAVVICAALQFGLSPSSDFMLRLERLENKFSARLVSSQREVVGRDGDGCGS